MTNANYAAKSVSHGPDPSPPHARRLTVDSRDVEKTHFSASLRYANVGVIRSAGIEAVTGKRLGGNWEFLDREITSRAVSRDGVVET